MSRVVITDCDHGFYDPEVEVAGARGADLRLVEGDGDALRAAGDWAEALLVQYVRVDGPLLDQMPNVRVIGRYGVGLDTIDLEAAAGRGITVVNVPDFCVEEVADHTLALALSVTRRIVALDREWRADVAGYNARWSDRFDVLDGVERSSRQRFGLVGFGRIGRAVARRAQACGFEVAAYDGYVDDDAIAAAGVTPVSLDEVVESSDVLSLHVPLDVDTTRMMDAARLARMRPDAVLVNTSRGALVDEDALAAALSAGRPGFAALDVFAHEPLPAGHPLFDAPNVVLTPHIAFFSRTSIADLKHRAMTSVLDALDAATP